MGELISIADIRQDTGLDDHIINHALKRHGPPHRGRVGIARVWSKDDLPAIREAISKTQQGSRHKAREAVRT